MDEMNLAQALPGQTKMAPPPDAVPGSGGGGGGAAPGVGGGGGAAPGSGSSGGLPSVSGGSGAQPSGSRSSGSIRTQELEAPELVEETLWEAQTEPIYETLEPEPAEQTLSQTGKPEPAPSRGGGFELPDLVIPPVIWLPVLVLCLLASLRALLQEKGLWGKGGKKKDLPEKRPSGPDQTAAPNTAISSDTVKTVAPEISGPRINKRGDETQWMK